MTVAIEDRNNEILAWSKDDLKVLYLETSAW